MKGRVIQFAVVASAIIVWSGFASAQQITQKPGVPVGFEEKLPKSPPPPPMPDYRIGPDDVLLISVWREENASGEVVVRPDGKITLKLGDEIVAAGLTTEELRKKVEEQLKKFYEDPVPAVQVQVKQMLSRRVYIEGAVNKPGVYPLTGPLTIIQLVTMAGGLQEWADKKNIMVISATLKDKSGAPLTYKVNYADLQRGRNVPRYNIELRPGDQVLVPGGEL